MKLSQLKILLRGCKNVYVRVALMPGKYIWAKGVKRHILQNLPDDIHKDDELLAEADDQWNLFIGYKDNEQ